ncbi:MAG: glycosyltransferase family 2 protein [Candidatus Krumholzibacteriota bacterium]|nr:glycosyltransferase family 2 protein [Candidatus Krumholzibacteriota bacterium]
MVNGSDGLSRLSLIVITLNEEDHIGKCLDSVRGAGEVIVVDSFSDDRTVEIARDRGARVYQREFISNADQKNWAIDKAAKDWLLILDADESLSLGLLAEIRSVLDNPGAEGYWLRRRSRFLGRQIKHCGWDRDYVLRLFRKGAGLYISRAVHEKLVLQGNARYLREPLDHCPYRDIEDYIDRMKSYSLRGAQELHKKRKRWFPGIITHPSARFFRMYLLQLGFLDGLAGLMLCSMAAAGVFFKYAFLREIYFRGTESADE